MVCNCPQVTNVAIQSIQEACRVGETGEMAAFDDGVSFGWRTHLTHKCARRLGRCSIVIAALNDKKRNRQIVASRSSVEAYDGWH